VQDLTPVLFFVGLALLFWLFLIRPQSRRQRELAHMQSTLEVGDDVMLTSGVYGTVRGLDDDAARVEIAEGVTIRVARGAVGRVVGDASPTEPDPDTSDDTTRNSSDEAGYETSDAAGDGPEGPEEN
jgi:preprotein translocase subunit YajC